MNKSASFGLVMAFLLAALMPDIAVGQRLKVNTKDMALLVEEWNIVHNGRALDGFFTLYADSLLFYTEQLPRFKAIRLKKEMFKKKPDFRQRIITDITISAYENQIIKCDFTKEVWDNSKWKSYPSYLLVKFIDNQFRIVGESDYLTDKRLNYRLDIGRQTELSGRSEQISSARSPITRDPSITTPDSSLAADQPLGGGGNDVPNDMITVPKLYVFVLVGLLLVVGFVLLISGTRKKGDTAKKPVNEEQATSKSASFDAVTEKRDPKAAEVPRRTPRARQPQEHLAFESLVTSLFDPLYFRFRKRKLQPVLANDHPEDEARAGMEFQFQNKDVGPVRFVVQCVYLADPGAEELQLFPEERLRLNRQLMEEPGIHLYYVIGLGGSPDNPIELYLLPGPLLKYPLVHKKALAPFRKFGMFFYNVTTGKLR